MLIENVWSWELPQTLKGFTAVVSDIYAATTNIPSFISRGAKELIIVNENNVLKAKEQYRNALVIGESLNLPENFFDLSNHPCLLEKLDVKDKTILYMTNNGSKVIEMAINKSANQVIAVSFVNIAAIASFLKRSGEKVVLISAGAMDFKDRKVAEDFICNRILADLLKGKRIVWNKNLRKAENFIRSYYKCKNMNQEIETLFSLNKYSVIPSCSINENGFIQISALS